MDISTFRSHKDDYAAFSPWFDVTTWVAEYTVQLDQTGEPFLQVHDQRIEFRDPRISSSTILHAVCLEALGFNVRTDMVQIAGLLVLETKPGSYRRVTVFSSKINATCFMSAPDIEEILEKRFKPEFGESTEAREIRISRLEKYIGPQVLENLPGEQWKKRTLRLV
ncbi:hypothetical protein EK21DRAFT_114875 [Setomelanomma holmii]|uniref:Uncharacterized protein n=1 Tax=Setomelanomma holmii TaxID=210430 RepID=A0A9P4H5A7_9PLEO|nr:hypothetical protein EK21DRAFT_114875 [Setomelanomma holmii]